MLYCNLQFCHAIVSTYMYMYIHYMYMYLRQARAVVVLEYDIHHHKPHHYHSITVDIYTLAMTVFSLLYIDWHDVVCVCVCRYGLMYRSTVTREGLHLT